ncbi:MAG: hypothetical protein P8X95_27130 [Anaerolineales bacterium]
MITLISKPERFFGVNQSSFCHNIPSTDSIRHPEQLNLSGRGTRSTVRRQSSIPNLQFSPASICSSKKKFKKSIEEQMLTPLFLPQMAVPQPEKGAIE